MVDNKTKTGVYTYNGEEFTFNFYTRLSTLDKLKFTNGVVDSVVDDNYNYVIRDLMIDYMIVLMFTDIDINTITDGNIDNIEEFLGETNVVEIVKMNADSGVIKELVDAVELGIEYKTGIHKNPIAESLSSLLDTVESKLESIDLESMMDVAQALSGMSGEFTADKVLEAYANSDIFKNQYKQLIADKEKHNEEIDEITNEFKVIRGEKQSTTSPLLSPTV